jgi:hypothetical protein
MDTNHNTLKLRTHSIRNLTPSELRIARGGQGGQGGGNQANQGAGGNR